MTRNLLTPTNAVIGSQDISYAGWSAIASTKVGAKDIALAPDGTMTAQAVIADATFTGAHRSTTGLDPAIFGPTLGPSKPPWFIQGYFKAGNRGFLRFFGSGLAGAASFDLTLGTGVSLGGITAFFIEAANVSFPSSPAGWWRCGVFFDNGLYSSSGLQIWASIDAAGNSYSGDSVTPSIYWWGIQASQTNRFSRYQPTGTVVSVNGRVRNRIT